MPKQIPDFENEDAEREFWDSHDSADYIDWSQAQSVVFTKLKPSTKTISLRLPEAMLAQIRLLANRRDFAYRPLIKVFLQKRIDEEFRS